MRLRAERSVLVVVDVQAKLVPAIAERARVIARTGVLVRAAALLGIPVVVTEHYARGIGETVPELLALAPNAPRFQKLSFAATGEADFAASMQALRAGGRDQVLLSGLEAHVCVMQTALGLIESGLEVAIAADAVASRAESSARLALERLRQAGAVIVDSEMAVFEWADRADNPAFRALLALIK